MYSPPLFSFLDQACLMDLTTTHTNRVASVRAGLGRAVLRLFRLYKRRSECQPCQRDIGTSACGKVYERSHIMVKYTTSSLPITLRAGRCYAEANRREIQFYTCVPNNSKAMELALKLVRTTTSELPAVPDIKPINACAELVDLTTSVTTPHTNQPA